MVQTPRTSLQKGQTVPDFTLTDLNGNRVSSRGFYLRRNLVIAITPSTINDHWRQWVDELSRAVDDIPDGDASVLVIVSEGQPLNGESRNLTVLLDPEQHLRERFGIADDEGTLVIADRYGVIFHVATGTSEDGAIVPSGVPGWVEFVVCRCS